jgi:hypothetical protein
MMVANKLARGENPYNTTSYLNWPPLWMQVIYAMNQVAHALHTEFITVLRGTLISIESVVIVLTALLLRSILPDRPRLRLRLLVLGISLNPAAILLVCQHQNFDVIPAAFVLAALLCLARFTRDPSPTNWVGSALFIGLGTLSKTVPLALWPLLAYRSRGLKPGVLAMGAYLVLMPVALGLSILYVLGPDGVSTHVLKYRSAWGYFGISGLLSLAGVQSDGKLHSAIFAACLLSAGVALAMAARRRNLDVRHLVLSAALILMAVPLFGPGYAPQYLYWYLPLFIATAGAFGRGWMRLLVAGWAVVGVSYVLEYGLIASHGAFLIALARDPTLAETALHWQDATHQTLLRLPLSIMMLIVFIVGCTHLFKALRWPVADAMPEGSA